MYNTRVQLKAIQYLDSGFDFRLLTFFFFFHPVSHVHLTVSFFAMNPADFPALPSSPKRSTASSPKKTSPKRNRNRNKKNSGEKKSPGGNNNNNKPKAICKNFKKDGTCRFGDKCRFQHTAASNSTTPSNPSKNNNNKTSATKTARNVGTKKSTTRNVGNKVQDTRTKMQEQMHRNNSVQSATAAADSEQQRRIVQDQRSVAQEQMTRQRNTNSAKKASDSEKQRRIALQKRSDAQEQMVRQNNQRNAKNAVDQEQVRRVSVTKRATAQEELQRTINTKRAMKAEKEEQKRRIQENKNDKTVEKRIRRRSMTLEADIMAGAQILKEQGTLQNSGLLTKSSWKQPKTPRTKQADHLRQRKLSMVGFPSLGSMPKTTPSNTSENNQGETDETGETKTSTPASTSTATATATSTIASTTSTPAASSTSPSTATATTSIPPTACLNPNDMQEFKKIRKQATAFKKDGKFKQAANHAEQALALLAKVPSKYFEQRAKLYRDQAVCYLSLQSYPKANAAIQKGHMSVSKMTNGQATTELLRWNLTYQLIRVLQKEKKFQRASALSKSLITEITSRMKQNKWQEESIKKSDELLKILVVVRTQCDKLQKNATKPTSNFGKGMFDEPKVVPKVKKSDVSSKKTKKQKSKKVKKVKKMTNQDADDESTFWLIAAGGMALLVGIAFIAMRK